MSLMLSACYVTMGEAEKDKCCYDVCMSYHEGELHYAIWQGDDPALDMTRCGCFVYPNDYEFNYIVPIKTCEMK